MQKLKDIAHAFKLYAVCIDCKRMEPLSISRLLANLGTEVTLDEVRQRVRCSACHLRTADIRIVYVGPCDRAAAFHYRES